MNKEMKLVDIAKVCPYSKRSLERWTMVYKKLGEDGTVERSHREDQEKFYEQNGFKNLKELRKKLKRWNMYYNDLEHCGLNGKTPNEILAQLPVN